jgi:TolB-like protein/Tfp pilus assembly protein PilF
LLAEFAYLDVRPAVTADLKIPPPNLTSSNPAQPDSKSVAVLPFANLSGDKEQEYFSDGLTEEVINALARERDLQVPGRSSSFSFKGRNLPAAEIARALNVARVVEGSVRKAGTKVRISVSLTRASDGFSEELGTFTEELADIFELQDKVAQAVVAKLTSRTTTEGKMVLTRNVAAYDEYMRGRAANDGGRTAKNREEGVRAFRHAVELDPQFAAAWGELAVVEAEYIFQLADTSDERKARADGAMAQALRLGPDSIDVLRAQGVYTYYRFRDYARATGIFEQLRPRLPRDASICYWLGVIQRRNHQWPASLANLQRAVELDPANLTYSETFAQSLSGLRRWPELRAELRRTADLRGGPGEVERQILYLHARWDVGRRELDAALARLPEGERSQPVLLELHRRRAFERRNLDEYRRLDAAMRAADDSEESVSDALECAYDYTVLGDANAARTRLDQMEGKLRERLANAGGSGFAWLSLAQVEALRGNREAALAAGRKGLASLREDYDPYFGPQASKTFAGVLAWCGEKELALQELQRLAVNPSAYLGAELAHRALWAPLHGDPRFQVIVDEVMRRTPLNGEVDAAALRQPDWDSTLGGKTHAPAPAFTVPSS